MDTQAYEEVLREAEKLPPDRRLLPIECLIRRVRTREAPPEAPPAWEDYAGSAPYPLCGEDAQAWVSRSRNESDQARPGEVPVLVLDDLEI